MPQQTTRSGQLDEIVTEVVTVMELTGHEADSFQLYDYVDGDALARLIDSLQAPFEITFEVEDVQLRITEDGVVSSSKLH